MKIDGIKTTSERVTIEVSHYDLASNLRKLLFDVIEPESVKKYDDWHINKHKQLMGVKEHYHGSDTHTLICEVSDELYEKYQAIRLVTQMIEKL